MEPVVNTSVQINDDVSIGGTSPLLLIAGPCVIEDRDTCMQTAEQLIEITDRLKIGYVFKASFDKANRSSIESYRGPGLEEGLEILGKVRESFSIPVTSDIHLPSQAEPASEVLDLIQIPAFLCRQTDLLISAAVTGKPLNVKKGQFMSPADVYNIADKIRSADNYRICITERGTCFGYNRLVNDFTGIPAVRSKGIPLIFDASHSVQEPGALGDSSGGSWEQSPLLARAAAGAGIDGLFIETHPDPEHAKCDAGTMVPLDRIEELLKPVIEIHTVVQKWDISPS